MRTPPSPMPDSRPAVRTPAADVENVVLDAAAELLASDGPAGLNIRRIAGAAAVSPMSIYNRFGDKAGLLDALFTRGFRQLTSAFDEAAGADALARLRAAGDAYRGFALANPGAYSIMFDRDHAGYEPSDDARFAAAACFERLVALVADAQAAGFLVGGSPTELAQRIWATTHGAVSLELRQICFANDSATHFDALSDTILLGLAPDRGIPGVD